MCSQGRAWGRGEGDPSTPGAQLGHLTAAKPGGPALSWRLDMLSRKANRRFLEPWRAVVLQPGGNYQRAEKTTQHGLLLFEG